MSYGNKIKYLQEIKLISFTTTHLFKYIICEQVQYFKNNLYI